jgi:flagellar biosynthesis protein FlhB
MVTQTLVTAVVFLVILIGLRFCWVRWCLLLEWHFSEGFAAPFETCRELVFWGAIAVSCVLASGAVGAILFEAAQVGLSFEWGILAPKAARLDPAQGLKRLGTSLAECVPGLVRLGVYAVFVFFFLSAALERFSSRDLLDRTGHLGDAIRLGGWLGGGALGCLAVFAGWEYLSQRKRFYRELSMSTDEVRRELKDDEGDPFIRAARRALHEELSFGERVRRIRRARVVVVARAGHSAEDRAATGERSRTVGM